MICGSNIGETGIETIVREADVSMYHAKQSGKGRVVMFEDEK